jgi:hypothetical protein
MPTDRQTYSVFCLSEALSPITHMARTEGNEAVIAREPVATENGVKWIPSISGNALRHRLVRASGAKHLVEALGLAGQLTFEQLNFLFHGGNLSQSTAFDDTKRLAEMWSLFPLFRLLGGALPDQIITGSLIAWRGALVCRENAGRIAQMLPRGFELPSDRALMPADSLVGAYQYTRSDARKTQVDLAAPSAQQYPEVGGSNLMIFAGQQVNAGALFVHGFHAKGASQLALGALLNALAVWQSEGGTIGGQSSRGHGRLAMSYAISPEADAQAAVDAYLAHTEATKNAAADWLLRAFDVRPKSAKAKKGATVNAATESDSLPL